MPEVSSLVGAANAIAAYQLYAGRVPPLAMQLLTYMALVSRDHDEHPWFSLGHEALAVHALGRPAPPTRADVKAVERGMSPLLSIGAIVNDRRAAVRREGRSTARYRLQLVHGEHASIDQAPVDNACGQGARTPDSGLHVPRNPSSRPPNSVLTPPGNRGTEEKEEKEERVKENHLEPVSNSRPSTADAPRAKDIDSGENGPTSPTNPAGPPECTRCGVLLDPDGCCRNRGCPAPNLAQIIPLRPTGTETR
jgi:hypothetical protein